MHEIDQTKLSDQTRFRLCKIKKIENYFIDEINQRKSYNKKFSKYVTVFDYIDKILIVLTAATGGVSIFSFTNVIRAPVWIASASFIDMDISHEQFIAIFKEKDRYEKMKENMRDENENEKKEFIKN